MISLAESSRKMVQLRARNHRNLASLLCRRIPQTNTMPWNVSPVPPTSVQETTACAYYSTSSTSAAWWNPFSKASSTVTSKTSKLASEEETKKLRTKEKRQLQERKDIFIALLAMEFRRLSNLQEENEATKTHSRDEIVSQAFEELEAKQLDAEEAYQACLLSDEGLFL